MGDYFMIPYKLSLASIETGSSFRALFFYLPLLSKRFWNVCKIKNPQLHCRFPFAENDNPPTPSTNQISYEFTVTIDGVVNKVKGTAATPVISLLGSVNVPSNYPQNTGVNMGISDITNSNYVEGYPFKLNLNFEKNILGKVRASIQFDGSGSSVYRDKYKSPQSNDLGQPIYSIGLISDTSKFTNMTAIEYSAVLTSLLGLGASQPLSPGFDLMSSDIQITDLGNVNGKTIKGYMPKTKLFYPTSFSYDGGLYSVATWSPPVELEFSFKAVRYN